nr:uncharacterized protein LOC131773803 [Pocillopora verrucosa]
MKIALYLIGAAWMVYVIVDAGKGKAHNNKGSHKSSHDEGHKLPCTDDEVKATMCLNGTCFALEPGPGVRSIGCHCDKGFTGSRCQYQAVDPDLLETEPGN